MRSASGMPYKFHKKNTAPTAKVGDLVSMHLILKTEDNKTVKNSYEGNGKPWLFPVLISQFEGDIYEAVSMLSKNDSATFILPLDSTFQTTFKKEVPENLKNNKQLYATISVLDIQSENQRLKYLKEQNEKTQQSLSEKLEKQKIDDEELIQNYLKKNGLTSYKTPSGLHYVIYEEGSGDGPKLGQSVLFNHETRLIDDALIESTYELGQPAYIKYNTNFQEDLSTIPGLMEGVSMAKSGSKMKLIIPSHLAYSYRSKHKIKPFSVLIMDIDVLGIR